ncbi:MAG: hypothetical protein R3C56_37000 [Pirellulaceae bacterium]
MFDRLGSFDEAFAESHVDPVRRGNSPLRRRKTIKQIAAFWLTKVFTCDRFDRRITGRAGATDIAADLERGCAVANSRIGSGEKLRGLRQNRFSSRCCVIVNDVLVSCLWCRIFSELAGHGTIAEQRQRNPVVYPLTTIASIIVGVDALIFSSVYEQRNPAGRDTFYVRANCDTAMGQHFGHFRLVSQ